MNLVDEITWLRSTDPYGHTGILIKHDGKTIYLDPVALVGAEQLPTADYVLVTHSHPDHLCVNTVRQLSDENTQVVSIADVCREFDDMRTHVIAAGESVTIDGVAVDAIAAHNGSHSEELGFVGYVITLGETRIYCSGDTGPTPEMMALSAIDIAVLNVRAPYCLSGNDVVAFAGQVKPSVVIPIHWMPEDDTYGDAAEIAYIRTNIGRGTELVVKDLAPL